MEREKGQTEMIRDDKDMEDIYENKILPCPFCGAKASLLMRSLDEFDVACSAEICFLKFGADWYLQKNKAIDLWNKRKNDIV